MPSPNPAETKTLDIRAGVREAAAAPPPESAPSTPLPVNVPGYQILAEVGRGGMGVVYKACHLHLNRIVALKMILAGSHAGPTELVRFRQEAEMGARLQHPNIVHTYEVGAHAGHSYLALEYVEGNNLAQKTAGIPQPPRDAAHLVELLARAVDYAHQNGVLHRDLTPGNVLLTPEGAPKLTDFGLARLLNDSQGMTATGAILGTPGYLAPEQVRGSKTDICPATDGYALGSILYYLLTGRPPFQAATLLETIRLTETEEPIPPSRLLPKVPRDLETICLKCLQKDPIKRYATARELADDLRRFLADEPIHARPVGRLERSWRWVRRNPGWAAMVGVVGLLLLALASGGTLTAVWLKAERDTAVEHQGKAETAERQSERLAFEALVSQAKAGRFSRRVGQRFDTLRAIREAVALLPALELSADQTQVRRDELRDLAITAMTLADIRKVREIPWPEGSYSLSADLIRGLYARGDTQGEVLLVRLQDGMEIARLPGAGHPVNGECLPDGTVRLFEKVTDADYRIRDWDPVTGQLTVRAERLPMWESGWGTKYGGRCLVWRKSTGTFTVYDHHFRLVQTFSPPGGTKVKIVWSRVGLSLDGRTLAYVIGSYGSAEERVVHLVDVDTGEHRADLSHDNGVNALVWLANGRTLATGITDTSEIRLWDLTAQPPRVVQHFTRQKGGAPCLGANRTGDLLSSTSTWSDGLRLWHPRTGQELLHFPGTPLALLSATEDGRLWGILDGKQSRSLWEAVPPREYLTLTRAAGFKPPDFHNLSISPDGRLIAAGVEEGVALWDRATGEERAFLRLGGKGTPWFEPHSGDLFTSHYAGLFRWPVRATAGDRVRLGPPEQWTKRGHFDCRISGSRDGRLIAVSGWPYSTHSVAFHQGPPRRTLAFGPHPETRQLHVSPDGRYVATAAKHGGGVKVWGSSAGQLVHAWGSRTGPPVEFSGNGRWLLTQESGEPREGCQLWEVGTWKPLWPVKCQGGYPATFSPDSQLVATTEPEGRLCLVDVSTGRTLARLEDPNQGRTSYLSFSPDSGRIVAASNDNQTIHLWDLRLIRRQLVELGLDWDGPALPNAPPDPATIRKIEIVSAEEITDPLGRTGKR